MSRLGIDVGGTFVDIVLVSADGGATFEKVLAESDDLIGAIGRGIEQVLARAGVAGSEVQ